jgi:hypothetical protein
VAELVVEIAGCGERTPQGAQCGRRPPAVLDAFGDLECLAGAYRWGSTGGHVRGIDLFQVADGLVTEKLACVKR